MQYNFVKLHWSDSSMHQAVNDTKNLVFPKCMVNIKSTLIDNKYPEVVMEMHFSNAFDVKYLIHGVY